MSVSTKSPLNMVGGQLFSGGPRTGQVPMTFGGSLCVSVFSGGLLSPGSGFTPGAVKTADQLLLWSGAGRLDSILPHTVISGVQTNFYDASTVSTSGGPMAGFRVLGLIPANSIGAFGSQLGAGPLPILPGSPFNSGLCVSCVSGTPGWTATFTPEVIPTNANGN